MPAIFAACDAQADSLLCASPSLPSALVSLCSSASLDSGTRAGLEEWGGILLPILRKWNQTRWRGNG